MKLIWKMGQPMAAVVYRWPWSQWRAKRAITRDDKAICVCVPVNRITLRGLSPWQIANMWEEWLNDPATYHRDAAKIAADEAADAATPRAPLHRPPSN